MNQPAYAQGKLRAITLYGVKHANLFDSLNQPPVLFNPAGGAVSALVGGGLGALTAPEGESRGLHALGVGGGTSIGSALGRAGAMYGMHALGGDVPALNMAGQAGGMLGGAAGYFGGRAAASGADKFLKSKKTQANQKPGHDADGDGKKNEPKPFGGDKKAEKPQSEEKPAGGADKKKDVKDAVKKAAASLWGGDGSDGGASDDSAAQRRMEVTPRPGPAKKPQFTAADLLKKKQQMGLPPTIGGRRYHG